MPGFVSSLLVVNTINDSASLTRVWWVFPFEPRQAWKLLEILSLFSACHLLSVLFLNKSQPSSDLSFQMDISNGSLTNEAESPWLRAVQTRHA